MNRFMLAAALGALLIPSLFARGELNDGIHLPHSAPLPLREPTRLAGEQMYVVHGDGPFLVFASPPGLVSVLNETGPLRIRGRFVDSAAGFETRSFVSKHIVIIEPLAKGRVELIVVPRSANSADQAIRRTIDVDTTPPPNSPPAHPAKFVLVVVEESAEATGHRASLFSDKALAERMKTKGHTWRVVDKDVVGANGQPPSDVKRFLDAAKGRPRPQLFLVDERGQTRLQTELPKSPAVLLDLLVRTGG